MSFFLRTVSVVATVLVTLGIGATAASGTSLNETAKTASSLSITRVQPTVIAGGRATFRVTAYNASPDWETVYLYVLNPDGNQEWTRNLDIAPGETLVSDLTTQALNDLGTYQLTASLYDQTVGSYTDAYAIFNVTAAPFSITRADASRDGFYPTVRDGFQDDVTFRYASSRQSNIGVEVINSEGAVVRSLRPRTFYTGGPDQWTWNGRSNARNPVPVGVYRVRFTATSAGETAERTIRVRVKSDTVTARKYDYWRGNQIDRIRGTGACSAVTYFSRADLDCWDFDNSTPDYAEVEYWFQLPRSARNISWGMRGSYGCCDSPGRVVKTGKRVSPTRYVVKVRVDGFRAYDVFRASVNYTYKRRR